MGEKVVIQALKGALERAVRSGVPNVVQAEALTAIRLAEQFESGQPLALVEGTATGMAAATAFPNVRVLVEQGRGFEEVA